MDPRNDVASNFFVSGGGMRCSSLRGAVLSAVVLLALAQFSAGSDEPTEFVEQEDGTKVPVFKAVNDEDYDDSDVIVLTPANFTETVNTHKQILVEFYAPWCGHCKQLKPEYGAAAQSLKRTHPEVTIAKFDAVGEGAEDITKEYGIEGFPTMKWFVDGVSHPKDCHAREAQDIVKWVAKRSGPPVKTVETKEDMELIKAESKYAIVGFFDDMESAEFKTYSELASHDDRFDFHVVSKTAIASAEGVNTMPKIVFYRQFDEPKVTYDKAITASDLADAVRTNSRPRLIEMAEENAEQIFDNDLPKLMLFRAGDALTAFKAASEDPELRGHFIFVNVGGQGDPGLGEFLGVNPEGTVDQ